MEGSQYTRDEPSIHNHHHITTQHSRPNSPSAAEVYQHHVQQQKQRLRYKPQMLQEKEFNEEESTAEPEWITSSMEPDNAAKDPLNHDEDDDIEDIKILPHDSEESVSKKSEKRSKEATPEHPKIKALKRKTSKEDSALQRPPKTETPEEFLIDDAATVPQTVEEIETMQQQQKSKDKSTAAANTSISSATTSSSSASSPTTTSSSPSTSAAHKTSSSSSSSSSGHSHHHTSNASGSSSSSHHGHHAAPPPPLHHPHPHHHYGKYVPDGYLINEHGILMTHDFIHAPTATIPTSAGAASNGNHTSTDDYNDMKLEEFNEAELRLTTEEMSQWQDVIKMDDYLAKGRRPQFWEEPFTRRVSGRN